LTKPIGIGIIGAGAVSRLHAAGYNKIASAAKIVAFADLDKSLAESQARQYGVSRAYGSIDELLRDPDIDAVDVLVPNAFHSDVVVQACEAGKHVFVEKPMARTVQECDRMIRAAEKANVNLMVNHSLRFFEPYTVSKKLIEDGEIGQFIKMRSVLTGGGTRTGWRTDPKITGGGMMMEDMVHSLYLTEWFIGKIRDISAMSGNQNNSGLRDPNSRTEDMAMIHLRSVDGTFGTIDGNLKGPVGLWDDRIETVGNKGMILINCAWDQIYRSPAILHYRGDGTWTAYRDRSSADGGRTSGGKEVDATVPSAFAKSVNEFVTSVSERRRPAVTGQDGRRVIELIEACYRSDQTEQVVHLT
jgi:predicted dehydrogenase